MSLRQCVYSYGPTHPNQQPYATFETKPSPPEYTGGGYEHWRSYEWRPHTARQSKESSYVSHHRLLSVVACYDADRPLDEVLADLRGKDVHHQSGVAWDNRPDNLAVLDHGEHSSVTQSQVRAWGEDAKREAADAQQARVTEPGTCPSCGEEMDIECTSAGFDGSRCVECAKQECDGETINV